MDHSKLWYLQKSDFFANLPQDFYAVLDKESRMLECRRGRSLYLPGDPANQVYILKQGLVKISKLTEDGKKVTLEILSPGTIFGGLPGKGSGGQEELAEVMDDGLICVLSRRDFEYLMERFPMLYARLSKLVGLRLAKIEQKLSDLLFKDIEHRLAQLFLELIKEFGVDDARGKLIRVKLTHQEVANLIGATRESVSVNIGAWRRSGWLITDGKRFILPDAEGLADRFMGVNA
ncbi:MAG: Crp/Fnr family transcriptional regulator [Mariprofundaceae bacterium]